MTKEESKKLLLYIDQVAGEAHRLAENPVKNKRKIQKRQRLISSIVIKLHREGIDD